MLARATISGVSKREPAWRQPQKPERPWLQMTGKILLAVAVFFLLQLVLRFLAGDERSSGPYPDLAPSTGSR